MTTSQEDALMRFVTYLIGAALLTQPALDAIRACAKLAREVWRVTR